MELRMYFFVPYNISPIQQAIQAGHAMGEYALAYGRYDPDHLIWEFLEKWKTWIILNGGTTNFEFIEVGGKKEFTGSLNQYAEVLENEAIDNATFIEPDLNNALTAVCFIVDERVFNYDDYPDLSDYLLSIDFLDDTKEKYDSFRIGKKNYEELKELFPLQYNTWERDIMGGDENVFLRQLLKGKKLA